MRNPYDHEYPPSEWTVEGLAAAFAESRTDPLPPRSDREAWATVRDDELTGPLARSAIEEAEAMAAEPLPELPASLVLASREDDDARAEYLDARLEHRCRLSLFALAECLEGDGRFLDDALDYAWEWCEWTTWGYPWAVESRGHATEHTDGLPQPRPAPEHTSMDLAASRVGFELAELQFLLGDALHPGLSERIRREVEARTIAPYEARDDYWWLDPPTNNWNAVCNGQALGAALYLEDDPERLARLTKKAVDSLYHFLAGFDEDGGTAEGVGYWNYGVRHFVRIAELLAARTDGEYSLLDVPVVEAIARFPLRTELSPDRYVAFSDSDEAVDLVPFLSARFGRRFDLPGLIAKARARLVEGDADSLIGATRNLVWCTGLPPAEPESPPPRTYFRGMEWWIVREDPGDPDGAVVAAKGGDNAESHNHADCGSFVYHYRGESLLSELGTPTYPSDYFGGNRYTYLMARSLGHSVPYVDGVEQASAPTDLDTRENVEPTDPYRSTVLDRTEGDPETFALELSGAYPEDAGLASLIRSFSFDRADATLRVEDAATFEDSGSFESVLVSYFPMRGEAGDVVIEGERGAARVLVDGDDPIDVEHLPDAVVEDYGTDPPTARDVWRARIGPVEGEEATVAFTVTPDE